MSIPVVQVRAALKSDSRALSLLAERIFRATFGATNTQDDMDRHCTQSFGVAQQMAEICDPAMKTMLVEMNGDLAAFGQMRSGAAPDCVSGRTPREIYRFYVDGAWHGRGVAQKLMGSLIDIALEQGADCVWLGVWEHNPRAIAFYEKLRFRPVGEHSFVLGSDKQRDLVLQLDL